MSLMVPSQDIPLAANNESSVNMFQGNSGKRITRVYGPDPHPLLSSSAAEDIHQGRQAGRPRRSFTF